MSNRTENTDAKKSQAQPAEEKPISMHEDVPVWYDCCSCEAEPYWLEAFENAEPEQSDRPTGEADDD